MNLGKAVCTLFCAATCVLFGCSTHHRQSSSIPLSLSDWAHLKQLYPTNFVIVAPTNFIKQIISADRVVARFRIQAPELKGISLTLAGTEATEVVKAISSLKTERIIPFTVGQVTVLNSPDCGCEDKQLDFFSSTNQLGAADFGGNRVYLDYEYQDHTTTLKRVEAALVEQSLRQ